MVDTVKDLLTRVQNEEVSNISNRFIISSIILVRSWTTNFFYRDLILNRKFQFHAPLGNEAALVSILASLSQMAMLLVFCKRFKYG